MTDVIKAEAERRHNLHVNHPTHRPLSEGYELVGLRGEEALARLFGGTVDLTSRPNGDGGVDKWVDLRMTDGTVSRFPIDIKTARKAFNLIVEQRKVLGRTIYILASYSDETEMATLLGWEWGYTLLRAPVRDFGKGVVNHFIRRHDLRDINEILVRLSGWGFT